MLDEQRVTSLLPNPPDELWLIAAVICILEIVTDAPEELWFPNSCLGTSCLGNSVSFPRRPRRIFIVQRVRIGSRRPIGMEPLNPLLIDLIACRLLNF